MFSVFISFLFVSLITYGATIISENINTGGTLTVSGNATLGDDSTDLIKSIGSFYASSTLQATGAVRFYSTARIDGATTLNTVSYTWPSSDGSASTYLQTNGAGALSWATVSSGASSDWLKQTNFGVLTLTASTTIPYWAKDAIYASSTLQVQGLATLTNASTTQLTNSGLSWFNNLATFTTASTTGSVTIGDTNADILTINAGTIQYLNSATTTIPQSINSWSIATSTSATSILTIDGLNGRVGVGTITPLASLGLLYTTPASSNTYYGQYIQVNSSAATGGNNYGLYVDNDTSGNGVEYGVYGKGVSYGVAGESQNGFALFGKHTGISNGGGALFLYSDSITSNNFAYLQHTNSSFSGDLIVADLADGSGSFTGNFLNFQNNNATKFIVKSTGATGIGTSTPTTMFQVATSTANATTTVEFGKANQNKGSCLKMYDTAGTVTYCTVTGTTFSCSATSCE